MNKGGQRYFFFIETEKVKISFLLIFGGFAIYFSLIMIVSKFLIKFGSLIFNLLFGQIINQERM